MEPPDSAPRPPMGIALALFVTGALLGDVLLLGRLLVDAGSWLLAADRIGPRSISLFHLEGVEMAFLLGFAVGLMAMIGGGFFWLSTGHPANRREAGWTLTGAILVLILVVSLVLVFVLDSSGTRDGMLVMAFVSSSVMLVYLVVSYVRAALQNQGH